jgi:hypothetical protein
MKKPLNSLSVDKDTLYYDEGYVRLIANYGDVKLAEKQIWVVADVRKIGTHDTPKNTLPSLLSAIYQMQTAGQKVMIS